MQVSPGQQVIDGLDVEVENPPLRIAFPQPSGLLDNWCAIVFDETGELLRVSPASPLSKLFGGDIVGCHALDGPYLFCCLT